MSCGLIQCLNFLIHSFLLFLTFLRSPPSDAMFSLSLTHARTCRDWHPHMGMCVLTYVQDGVGRFADSLGNAFEVQAPGVAW